LGQEIKGDAMASVKDIEQVTDDLEKMVEQLRSEIRNGPDFAKLVEIVDALSERADDAATTFSSMDEALVSRLSEIRGGKGRGARSRPEGASRQSSQKSESAA
jgi:hypothetical protein